ncbi:hypothetical protein V8E54_007787 [Elaphomyces granulatus]
MFSHLFPSCFSPPSKPPNLALSVDNVMDISIPMSNTRTASPTSMKENIVPTIQEVKLSHTTKLVEWIQQVLDLPLDRDDEKKIMEGKFDGESSGRCWEPGLLYACWPLIWDQCKTHQRYK